MGILKKWVLIIHRVGYDVNCQFYLIGLGRYNNTPFCLITVKMFEKWIDIGYKPILGGIH
jgi:hypothetical protein